MLKLRFAHASPFARKVMMTALEAGLADRIEKVVTDAWTDASLGRDNPLGKVPALLLEDGSTLYDSPVIAEYLDSLNPGTPLFPKAGPARWRALRLQALADGICDAAVLRRVAIVNPESLPAGSWLLERQRDTVTRGCDALEDGVGELDGPPTIGTLAVLAALGYLDYRFAGENWRTGRPALTQWFAAAADRDSFRLTAPPAA